MSVARTVLRNVASSWVGLASQIALTLILTPFVITKLGLEAYGVWLLLQATVGYYGLVDMGLRAGLTQTITRRIARNDIESVRRHLSAAIPALSLIGMIVPVIALLLCFILPWAVQMSPELSAILWIVILIQAFTVAFQMPLAPYDAVLVGTQRYDISNGLAVATRVAAALLTYVVLGAGGGLIGFSVVNLVVNVSDGLLRCWVANRLLPGIGPVRFTWDRTELREIANVGIWNFFIHISRQLIYFSDALTVSLLFSASAVAPFGIANALIDYANRLVMISTRVLFPTMSTLREQGNHGLLRQLYLTATKITLAISITIVLVGSFWSPPFLQLWLGESSQHELIHTHVPMLFVVLGVAFTFISLQRAGIQLLLAENKLRFLSLALLVEAVANLILSIYLGWTMGLVGVALGTAIPAALMCFAVHLPTHSKILKMSYVELLTHVLVRPVLYGLLLTPTLYLLSSWIPGGQSWLHLMGAGMLAALAVGVCFFAVLSANEILFVWDKSLQLLGKTRKNIHLAFGKAGHA